MSTSTKATKANKYFVITSEEGILKMGSMRRRATAQLLVLTLFIFMDLILRTNGESPLGINYGRNADNLPPPPAAVALIQSLGVGSVRIFDSDPQVLAALANTGLNVAILLKNEEIPSIAASQDAANLWVQQHVAAFLPATRIAFINVGNEVVNGTDLAEPTPLSLQLAPAMANILSALNTQKLNGPVKVTTSLSMDLLVSGTLFPPSISKFRSNILPVIVNLLDFLTENSFPLFLNAYPYEAWTAGSEPQITLDYALFKETEKPIVTDHVEDLELSYYNVLDVQVDAVVHAMERLGFHNVDVVISETGWPSGGGDGATAALAAAYNQGLVNKLQLPPSASSFSPFGSGTPLRPNAPVPTFIYSLFNENLQPGAPTRRNFGLFYPNGTLVYPFHINAAAAGVNH